MVALAVFALFVVPDLSRAWKIAAILVALVGLIAIFLRRD